MHECLDCGYQWKTQPKSITCSNAGCPDCALKVKKGWINWSSLAKKPKLDVRRRENFYIVHVVSPDGVHAIKPGITVNKAQYRYNKYAIGDHKVDVLFETTTNLLDAFALEQTLLEFNETRAMISKNFNGYTECRTDIIAPNDDGTAIHYTSEGQRTIIMSDEQNARYAEIKIDIAKHVEKVLVARGLK